MMDCLYAKCEPFVFSVYCVLTMVGGRYSLRYRLCYGRAGKTGASISCSPSVSGRASYFAAVLTVHYVGSVARDPRFERLSCSHTGTYADDCLVQRVTSHKCYIVATCDRELRRRIRQVPGVPLMYIVKRRYAIERLPDHGAPA
jgi:hypothetical protein